MRHATLIALALLAAGCSAEPQDSEAAGDGTPADALEQDTEANAAPGSFAETAWRSTSEDGALFTTYLDRDGTYRDLRNGDPWQTGQWTFNATGDERLCFTPDDEDGVERCWKPESMREGTMAASGPGDRRIELERVDYQLPEDGSDAAA